MSVLPLSVHTILRPVCIAVLTLYTNLAPALITAHADDAAHETSEQTIRIDQPYIRLIPAGAAHSAAYMTITSATDDRLIRVTGSLAQTIELHEHIKQDDVMQMRPVDSIALPARKPVHLQPGGLHIMLINLKQPVTAGEKHELTLHFAQSEPVVRKFVVKPVSPNRRHKNKRHEHHQHHEHKDHMQQHKQHCPQHSQHQQSCPRHQDMKKSSNKIS